jgi:hypothetical protein
MRVFYGLSLPKAEPKGPYQLSAGLNSGARLAEESIYYSLETFKCHISRNCKESPN